VKVLSVTQRWKVKLIIFSTFFFTYSVAVQSLKNVKHQIKKPKPPPKVRNPLKRNHVQGPARPDVPKRLNKNLKPAETLTINFADEKGPWDFRNGDADNLEKGVSLPVDQRDDETEMSDAETQETEKQHDSMGSMFDRLLVPEKASLMREENTVDQSVPQPPVVSTISMTNEPDIKPVGQKENWNVEQLNSYPNTLDFIAATKPSSQEELKTPRKPEDGFLSFPQQNSESHPRKTMVTVSKINVRQRDQDPNEEDLGTKTAVKFRRMDCLDKAEFDSEDLDIQSFDQFPKPSTAITENHSQINISFPERVAFGISDSNFLFRAQNDADARELFNLNHWKKKYFSVNHHLVDKTLFSQLQLELVYCRGNKYICYENTAFLFSVQYLKVWFIQTNESTAHNEFPSEQLASKASNGGKVDWKYTAGKIWINPQYDFQVKTGIVEGNTFVKSEIITVPPHEENSRHDTRKLIRLLKKNKLIVYLDKQLTSSNPDHFRFDFDLC
jgi:hypothetical protein